MNPQAISDALGRTAISIMLAIYSHLSHMLSVMQQDAAFAGARIVQLARRRYIRTTRFRKVE
jgi:hypothetical protein